MACFSIILPFLCHTESVVAESVVVIKKLLQTGANQDYPLHQVVKQMAKLLPEVSVPKARASIIWIIGEYHEVRQPYSLNKLHSYGDRSRFSFYIDLQLSLMQRFDSK